MSNPDFDSPNYQSASGISRRKTGCWTCRIRRKRCDEIQDEQGRCDECGENRDDTELDSGRCQECRRLKIPCAGWGEKRPEHLKVSWRAAWPRHRASRAYTVPRSVNAHRTYFQDEDTLRTFKENIKKQLMTRAPARGAPPVSAPIQSTSGSEMADSGESRLVEGSINANGIVPIFYIDFSKHTLSSNVPTKPST
jgi:hypothetical protein